MTQRMMAEHGITVSHTSIMRWVMRYVPEFERRWSRYASRLHSSWRMDETAVPVRGGRHYLYRAVDKYGRSVDSLLCADRGIGAAQAFFRKAVDANYQRWPRKVNVDGHMATHVALHLLRDETLGGVQSSFARGATSTTSLNRTIGRLSAAARRCSASSLSERRPSR